MKGKALLVSAIVAALGLSVAPCVHAGDIGEVNWVGGYVSAIGNGAFGARGNMAQARPMAKRAAYADAYRNLLEMVKGVKIDSSTTVEDFTVTQDIIRTRIEGVVKGAKVYKETFEAQPDGSLLATVEMRVCLSSCIESTSIVQALGIDQRKEPASVPQKTLQEIPLETAPPEKAAAAPTATVAAPAGAAVPAAAAVIAAADNSAPAMPAVAAAADSAAPAPRKEPCVTYDSSRPVTGIILNLEGLLFERVLLPVIVADGLAETPVTVYSVKRVTPPVVRTQGIVRYADTVEQARGNARLGDNAMVVPAASITKENLIVIKADAARLIKETTAQGNDYLSEARVVIAAQ